MTTNTETEIQSTWLRLSFPSGSRAVCLWCRWVLIVKIIRASFSSSCLGKCQEQIRIIVTDTFLGGWFQAALFLFVCYLQLIGEWAKVKDGAALALVQYLMLHRVISPKNAHRYKVWLEHCICIALAQVGHSWSPNSTDLYFCQQTNTKDIAGQSAKLGSVSSSLGGLRVLCKNALILSLHKC